MANSNRKPRKGFPSFFKIVIDPSASHLQLPPAFVRRYLKDKIPKKPTLKLETGEHSWQLKIKQIEGNYCFASGWDKVVEDAHLGFGDFLVFWLMDEITFLASIYGPNGCEKDLSKFTKKCDCDCKRTRGTTSTLPVRTEIKIEDEDEDEDEIEGEAVKNNCTVKSPEQYPCFQKIIYESNSHILRLPREFILETRIDCKKSIIMKDLQGREWPLKLHCEKMTRGSDRYYLSGWQKMKEHNDVANGDICLFKFIESEGTLVLSQVVKSKAEPRNRETRPQREQRTHVSTPATETTKRKRGRPPKRRPCLVEVKSEEESDPDMVVEVVNRKRGRPPLSRSPKSGNHVVYF